MRTISWSSGSAGGISIQAFDVPFLSCRSEHARRWCVPDFGMMLIEELHAALPHARRRLAGVRRAARCRRCRGALGTASPAPVQVEVPVELRGAPPFRVQLEATGVACPACGERQLTWRPAAESDFADALAEAVFERPRLKP